MSQQFEPGRATTFLRSLAVDEAFGMASPDGVLIALHDALGSIVAAVDGSGTSTASYTYEPFGATSVNGQDLGHAFQFTSRENDGVAGLYYYRARFYRPALGRFISEDPIALFGGERNPYAYAQNNPLEFVDP